MKKIYVHIGPPKTGSSVIQYWLNSNYKWLEMQGIYYPPHSIGHRNESCGNFYYVLDCPNSDDNFYFNEEKAVQLLDKFNQSNFDTLLLSSEIFQRELICSKLNGIFPDAKFIYYLRDLFELPFSIYNQLVKSHGYNKVFSLESGKKYILDNIKNIKYLMSVIGKERIIFRAYHPALFYGGSIITDFIQGVFSLPVPDNVTSDAKIVNKSYVMEAIDFIRNINSFDLPQNHKIFLADCLNTYKSSDEMKKVLLSENDYQVLKEFALDKSLELANLLNIQLIRDIGFLTKNLDYKHQLCFSQKNSMSDNFAILKYIDNINKYKTREICKYIHENMNNSTVDTDFGNAIVSFLGI